jgi:plastocyanin
LSSQARDRALVPAALPILLLGVIGASVFLFSRILLNVEGPIAVAIALMTAFNLLAFFSFMSWRIGKANPVEKVMALGVAFVPVILGLAISTKIIPTKGGEEAGHEASGPTKITLAANNLKFAKDTVEAPAGAEVEVTLDNKDSQPHNFVAVEGQDASGKPLNSPDKIAESGQKVKYTFTSPAKPGEYFFYCALHPAQMTGKLVVTEAKGGEGGKEGGGEVALSANNLKFDKDEISVKAGSKVKLVFTNKESQPHNFQLFQGEEPSGAATFTGEVVTGPNKKATYNFDAPAQAGTFAFNCQVHPTQMVGKLVAE